jgi:Ca2+-binding RTX toxin-like protein
MSGFGSSIKMGESTFKVGLQSSLSSLKSVASGLPAGVTISGESIVVRQAGVVLDGYDLRNHSVYVQASNVTIRNSLFNATGQHTLQQGPAASGMVVEFNTFDGGKSNSRTHNVMVLSENAAIVRNNEFFDLPSDAVNTAGGLVEHNYIAGASYQLNAHADAISVHRTTGPLTIRGNYIDYVDRSDAPQGTNAAIKIVSHFGTINDVTVDSNVLLGGGYTIYAGQDRYAVSNVRIINNDVGLGKHGGLIDGNHGANFVYANTGPIAVSSNQAAASASAPPIKVQSVTASPKPQSADTLVGTNSHDRLLGTAGKDVIALKNGADLVYAHGGDDIIKGGGGKDWMFGQSGSDVFVYISLKDSRAGEANRDEILDWASGADMIDLRRIDADTTQAGNQAFSWIGLKSYSGTAGELRYVTDGSFYSMIGGDVDGDRKSDFHIEIRGGSVALSAADFYL